MNFRSQLRLLHPFIAVLMVVPYLTIAAGAAQMFFHFGARPAWFLAMATALPLLLGLVVAGAAHEVMHRPFALLLPGAARRLRVAAGSTIALLALFACAATALVEPSVPPPATFGLACALLAAPLADRHRVWQGVGWTVAAAAVWMAAAGLVGRWLEPAMIAAPAPFLIGGVVIAAVLLAAGCSPKALRNRAGVFHVGYGSLIRIIFDRKTQARYAEQRLMRRSREEPGRLGASWRVATVAPTTRAWMRVVWHAFAGRRGEHSFLRVQLTFAVTALACTLSLPLTALLLRGGTHSLGWPSYWQLLGRMAAPGPLDTMQSALGPFPALAALVQPGLAALFVVVVPGIQLPYPVSRTRMADTVFGLNLVQIAVGLVVPGAVVLLCATAGQLLSRQVWPLFGTSSVLAVDLLLAVYLPLMACASAFQHAASRIAWSVPIGLAVVVASLLRSAWVPWVLSGPGVAIVLGACLAVVLVLRTMLRRHYRVCDLRLEFVASLAAARTTR